jgi:hypothetical protein
MLRTKARATEGDSFEGFRGMRQIQAAGPQITNSSLTGAAANAY